MTQTPPLVSQLDQVMLVMQRLIDHVTREQWDKPTPCTEWNVRALVNHIVFGNLLFAQIARGERQGTPPMPQERAADHLGADAAESYFRSAAQLREAFSQPGFLDRIFPSPIGEQPGAGLLHMRVTEHLLHGWDLARATGQQPDFPGDLAEGTLEAMRQRLEGRPRSQTPFGEEQPAPADAPAIDRLAAYTGRRL
jgi:uncharacterized protein (TIGR03086 family)